MKFEVEETSSHLRTSMTSEDDETKDAVDPLMFCSPRPFAFNQGTYEVMVKDLLGIIKVTVESSKDLAKGEPLNLNAWRCMKSRVMLELYILFAHQTV